MEREEPGFEAAALSLHLLNEMEVAPQHSPICFWQNSGRKWGLIGIFPGFEVNVFDQHVFGHQNQGWSPRGKFLFLVKSLLSYWGAPIASTLTRRLCFPLSPRLLSPPSPSLRGRCPAPPKRSGDCGFLGGLISGNNGLLGPCVSYVARI